MCMLLLQVLSLRKCVRVTDDSLAAVAQNGSLEQLSVNANPTVGAATMKALALFCRHAIPPLSSSSAQLYSDDDSTCQQLS